MEYKVISCIIEPAFGAVVVQKEATKTLNSLAKEGWVVQQMMKTDSVHSIIFLLVRKSD